MQCTTVCYVDDAIGNDANGGATAADAKKDNPGRGESSVGRRSVIVAAGIYNEDVNATKANVTLQGAGIDVSTIVGPIGGTTATVQVTAGGVVIEGFTITQSASAIMSLIGMRRLTAGVAVQSQGNTVELRNSEPDGKPHRHRYQQQQRQLHPQQHHRQ